MLTKIAIGFLFVVTAIVIGLEVLLSIANGMLNDSVVVGLLTMAMALFIDLVLIAVLLRRSPKEQDDEQ